MRFIKDKYNIFKKVSIFVVVLFITSGLSFAGVLHTGDADTVFKKLLKIENKMYGKTYEGQALKERIKRIEKSFYGECSIGSLVNRLKCVEKDLSIQDRLQSRKRQKVFLELIEKRYYNQVFEDPFEKRIARLEKVVFGSAQDGDVDYRYQKLMQKVPIVLPLKL